MMDIKRLFFGIEVIAPWPETFPEGRVLLEQDRHLTLSFIGDESLPRLQEMLPAFPRYPFKTGMAGVFDKPLFLPHRRPRVAAWHVKWLEGEERFSAFQQEVVQWLKDHGVAAKEGKGGFLPHVTVARSPFKIGDWRASFEILPLFTRNIHLCESLGHSRYEICWSYPVLQPFEAREHTADLAFLVRGQNLRELYTHAALAMSFHFPPFIEYLAEEEFNGLDDVVAGLNRMIARSDQERGVPFKAVSHHGSFINGEWEMVVDV